MVRHKTYSRKDTKAFKVTAYFFLGLLFLALGFAIGMILIN